MKSNDFKKIEILWRYPTTDDLVKALKEEWGSNRKDEILKRLRRIVPKESFYQKEILKYLDALDIPHWAVKIAQGPYSRGGVPDIHFESGGRCIHFEVKRPYVGEESDLQKETRKAIKASGGMSYVVIFPEEVQAILTQVGFINT